MAARGQQKKNKNHCTAEMGWWTAQGGSADKQKAPSVSLSLTFGHSAITVLHTKCRALGAEARAEKSSDGKTNCQALCLMSVFSDTLDRREWEQGCGSCGKGTDNEHGENKKQGWCNKSCQ